MEIFLKEHLDNWVQKQHDEVEAYCSNSGSYLDEYKKCNLLKKIDLANSFTRDGWVDEEKWENGPRVLYVLKEANVHRQLKDAEKESSVCADKSIGFTDDFWYRHCILKKEISWKRAIFRRLKKIGDEITGDSEFDLATTAYMNINKRGGMNNAREDIIADYYKEYKNEILEEIRILNPKIIAICCGEQGYAKDLKKAIKTQEWGKEITVKMYYHPAVRKKGITDGEYLKGINF